MNRVAKYLKENNITQATFAERMGITQPAVSRIIRGKHVSPRMALRIERTLEGKLSAHDIVFGPIYDEDAAVQVTPAQPEATQTGIASDPAQTAGTQWFVGDQASEQPEQS